MSANDGESAKSVVGRSREGSLSRKERVWKELWSRNTIGALRFSDTGEPPRAFRLNDVGERERALSWLALK